MMSIDDMDNFEQKEFKKIRSVESTWYDWLIDFIPEPTRKSVDTFKDKVLSLFKTNNPKQTVYEKEKKLSKSNTKNIRNPFLLKKKKNKLKKK